MTVLNEVLADTLAAVRQTVRGHRFALEARETGRIIEIGDGIARVGGLPNVRSEELVILPGNRLGLAFNLDPGEVGVILLNHSDGIDAGAEVWRTGRVLDTPVGDGMRGRVVDPTGKPLDHGERIIAEARWPVERTAPPIHARAAVDTPLQTGLKLVDALVPVGRGQRELILGDRQSGKTTIAVDTILNQKGQNVLCIYCAIGQRSSAVAGIIRQLESAGALDYTTVVATTADDPAGLQFIAPYAATTMAEFWMEQGRDVLVVYDDLTRHAWAYRELSLLLRRPPGREAYPGDIFYIHSRLLERATHLSLARGGGSLTALPIAETQAQNLSAYIPTNLISITDGQIFLSPVLQQRGIMPAVDVGRSVSRVGGKAQLPAYRSVTGDLRLAYSQFEELERFSRYGARLDDERQRILDHGVRVREILKQPPGCPLSANQQIAVLWAVTRGHLDAVPLERIGEAESAIITLAAIEFGTRAIGDEMGTGLATLLESLVTRAVAASGESKPGSDGNA